MAKDHDFNTPLGLRMRFLRQAANKTMRQVHAAGGPTPAFQSDIENGKRGITVGMLCRWCDAVECMVEDVISIRKTKQGK